MNGSGAISVQHFYAPPSDAAGTPALALQVTALAGSYMLWAGATECAEEDVRRGRAVAQGVLARDWACAMPPLGDSVRSRRSSARSDILMADRRQPALPPQGTALFSSAASDYALAMAQRLGECPPPSAPVAVC
jgi:proteasome assembly chaperone 4